MNIIKSYKSVALFFGIIILIGFAGCNKSTEPEPEPKEIMEISGELTYKYFNSGWYSFLALNPSAEKRVMNAIQVETFNISDLVDVGFSYYSEAFRLTSPDFFNFNNYFIDDQFPPNEWPTHNKTRLGVANTVNYETLTYDEINNAIKGDLVHSDVLLSDNYVVAFETAKVKGFLKVNAIGLLFENDNYYMDFSAKLIRK